MNSSVLTPASFSPSTTSVEDFDFTAGQVDVDAMTEAYRRHGAVVVRGLSEDYVADLLQDMEAILEQSQALLPEAAAAKHHANAVTTPDGTLFNADPSDPGRMVVNTLRLNAMISGAFLRSLINPELLELLAALIGPDIELWKWGQCVYKQPRTGVPKSLHQDGYYFEHKLQSPTAVLSYAVDVDMGNAPLYVVPGSHELGLVRHEDDRWAGFALNDPVWWERAVPIEGSAGDAVIFHTCTIHGSPDNRSDRPRPVFIKRYRRADDFCVIDVANVADRQRAEQAPVAAKTEDDWGLMVRGIRRFRRRKVV